MATGAGDVIASEMVQLSMGQKAADGKDMVDLFEGGSYSDQNINMRGHIKSTLKMYFSVLIVTDLW